ncbi:MAG TPA: hypothetical protein VKP30_06765 [Polyangiaceae bacterium]|nr:hypothetical protein [Polyangiaceae bacterium]
MSLRLECIGIAPSIGWRRSLNRRAPSGSAFLRSPHAALGYGLLCLLLGFVPSCARDVVIGEQFAPDGGAVEHEGTETEQHSTGTHEMGNDGNGGETARRGTSNGSAEPGPNVAPMPSQSTSYATPRPQSTAYDEPSQLGTDLNPDAGALDSSR